MSDPPDLQSTYRHEKYFRILFGALTPITFLPNYCRGLAKAPLPSSGKGALTKTNSSEILFGALAGISGKSPVALTK